MVSLYEVHSGRENSQRFKTVSRRVSIQNVFSGARSIPDVVVIYCRLSNYGFVWLVFSQWHLSSGASPLRLRSTPLLSLSSLPFELASFQFLHRDSRVAVQYLMWLIQGVQIQTALPGMKGSSIQTIDRSHIPFLE